MLLSTWMLWTCSDDNNKVQTAPDCPLADCSELGYACGEVPDGVGGCKLCGLCNFPDTCGGGGVEFQCGCEPRSCHSLGKNCGMVQDPCTGEMHDCGACTSPETCGGAGTPNVCGAVLGEGEPCDEGLVKCGSGLRCCGEPATCVPSAGVCPGAVPDLVVDAAVLANTVETSTRTVGATDCAVQAGCLPGAGRYRLLRFETRVSNQGEADLVLGHPSASPDFVSLECAGEPRRRGFLEYRLVDRTGNSVVPPRTEDRCVEDTLQVDNDASVNASAYYRCSTKLSGKGVQGIQRGWAQSYPVNSDCQWLDITGVTPGTYWLEVTVNPDHEFLEASFLNNVATATVTFR